jgi:hypothetical protein
MYSSYLGSKKCNNVICVQGEPGPRGIQGPVGPTGPSGNPLNNFTIISSNAVYIDTDKSINWNIDIPFIYGKQFTFTFHTNNNTVKSLPANNINHELISTDTYIFGIGQSVYQPYDLNISGNITTKYGYILNIISRNYIEDSNFIISNTVDTINLKVNYKFTYYNNADINQQFFNTYFAGSNIQLDGIKC